jgi:hypothetical protein
VTVEVFDADLLVPSALHDPGDAYGVVTIAFIDLHSQGCLGMPGIDTDHRQSQQTKCSSLSHFHRPTSP